MAVVDPKRGEIWTVTFREAIGQEIGKDRPALVMNLPQYGRKRMRIVVPLTTGREQHQTLPWMIRIRADSSNQLDHDSFADVSQVQPAAIQRFLAYIGRINDHRPLDNIASAIGLCVGHPPRQERRRGKRR